MNSRKKHRSLRKSSKRTRKQRGGQITTTTLGELTTVTLGDEATTTLGEPTTTTVTSNIGALLENALAKTIPMNLTILNTAATMAMNQYTNATPEQQSQINKISDEITPFLLVASWIVIKPIVFDSSVDPTTINIQSLLQTALAKSVKMTPAELGNTNNIAKARYYDATPAQKSQLETVKNMLEPLLIGTKLEVIQNIMLEVPPST